MSSRLELKGLDELRRALRDLPEDLADEAGAIVLAHAEQAQQDIVRGYAEGPTGNLKRGVVVERNRSKFGSRAIVRSRAKHAHLYEFGTGRRQTQQGWNRGSMPKALAPNAMIPKVIRARRRMTEALIGLVRKAGFQVDA